MFEIKTAALSGLRVVKPVTRRDARGFFTKTTHANFFEQNGMRCDFAETYYSVSERHVLRGMHFQVPPQQHAKLVYCVQGAVLDVTVDLRRDSLSFGRSFSIELDGDDPCGIYIPEGFAHGFLTLSAQAILSYFVTSIYAPDCDSGIRWNSIGFDWPQRDVILSERDAGFLAIADFESPF